MANGFNKLNVKSAVKSRNKFDLSRTHLTTLDFGQILPLFCEETVPGDKFSVDGTFFSRMAPLVKPTYGKFYFKTAEYFVPYYQVCDGIDAWMAGRSTWEGDNTTSRFTTRAAILALFVLNSDLATAVSAADVATGAWYDIKYTNSSNQTAYVKFTAKGKLFNKILNSLGYVIPENGNMKVDSAWYVGLGSERLSVLPLLAFAKAYNDWMCQAQRFNTSVLSKFLKDVKHNIDVKDTIDTSTYLYESSVNLVRYKGLYALLNNLRLCYENDYFTSAWMLPNAPIFGDTYDPGKSTYPGEIDLDDSSYGGTLNGKLYTDTANNTYLPIADSEMDEEGGVSTTVSIAQRSLDWLKSFDDWVRRNNYSGSRAVQQVYSRFGIKTEDYKSNYAHLIDTDTIPVQVGDVTALGQDFVSAGSANNVELGDYAGKGIVSGSGKFEFNASDYGMLFVLGWYTVDPMNVYGMDRTVLRSAPIDYYNPEFDGIGADPISVGEVFVNPRETFSTQDNATFGFTERYNAYRYGKDRITGDFRKMTLTSGTYAKTGTEMNVWHTGRMLNSLMSTGSLVAQNPDFSTLDPTGSEYNRIFSITDDSVDHFYLTAQFRVSAVRPMLSLNQVPRLGEGDTTVSRNGNEVN